MTDTSDEDDFNNNPPSLVEQVAQNMAIYARVADSDIFKAQAEQLLRTFEIIEGRAAVDYLEVEEWSRLHLDAVGARFLVLRGDKQS